MYNLFTPKYNQFDSFTERGKYLMAYRLTLLFTSLFLLLTVLFIGEDPKAFNAYCAALLLCGGSLLYLLLIKKYKLIFFLYGFLGSALTHFALNYSMVTAHYNDFLWMFAVTFLVFVGLGRIWGLIILVLNALASSYFVFVVHNEHIRVVEPFDLKMSVLTYLELVAVFFVVGFISYQFLLFQKYTDTKIQKANLELKTQNELILSKNNENIALVKEIHHRVKNNLQIIVSLLRLQQSEMKDKDTQEEFTEAINRVMVMSSIHQRLYNEKEMSRVDVKSYVQDLAGDLKTIYSNTTETEVILHTDYLYADLKTIVPLGLLLNELISNSFKYAFENISQGRISITLKDDGEYFSMTYADNGRWKPKESSNPSFGLDLINILTEQLNGKSSFNTDDTGTRYDFEFSKLG